MKTELGGSLRVELARLCRDAARIDAYYLPVARFVESERARAARSPLVVGVTGPQGCGKSTLAAHLSDLFSALCRPSVAISIDDFYLTREAQVAVAQAHQGNRYLEHRGYPGTHDVALGQASIDSIIAGRPTRVPTYDKSLHAGRGDRAADEKWRLIKPPIEILFLEGWLLGFRPLDESLVEPAMRAPNEFLTAYQAWFSALDVLVFLEVPNPEDIVRFRVDAERARREGGETALSDAEAKDYIERFLPAYRAYLPQLREGQPGRATLHIQLGADRLPLDDLYKAQRISANPL